VARMECPPSSKKLSWIPTSDTRSRSRNRPAISDSTGFRGGTTAPSSVLDGSIAGSARRSTLPFGVSGIASRRRKAEGTM